MFEFTANNKNLKVESLTHHIEKPIIGSNLNISYLEDWSGIREISFQSILFCSSSFYFLSQFVF